MIADEIRADLFQKQDLAYRDFQGALIPTVARERMTGVRTPELRALAKIYAKRSDVGDFLSALPHAYFDEDQLHAFIISEERDFSRCLALVCAFLPFVDNWATCDQLSPTVFGKHKKELLPAIEEWLASGKTYAVRFGIKMLMTHFLDADFDPCYLDRVASIPSKEYYVHMMIAWYFATSLAKQYKATLPYLEDCHLDEWTQGKAISKAVESRRITDEQKAYLRSLRTRQ